MRHFAQFTVGSGSDVLFGVIRPGWNVEWGEYAEGHCFYMYDTFGGERFPGGSAWEGRQGTKEGDRIGLLLDFDQGSMTVWKNVVKVEVMAAEGLSGPLCWAVCCSFRAAVRASIPRRRPRRRRRKSWRPRRPGGWQTRDGQVCMDVAE